MRTTKVQERFQTKTWCKIQNMFYLSNFGRVSLGIENQPPTYMLIYDDGYLGCINPVVGLARDRDTSIGIPKKLRVRTLYMGLTDD